MDYIVIESKVKKEFKKIFKNSKYIKYDLIINMHKSKITDVFSISVNAISNSSYYISTKLNLSGIDIEYLNSDLIVRQELKSMKKRLKREIQNKKDIYYPHRRLVSGMKRS